VRGETVANYVLEITMWHLMIPSGQHLVDLPNVVLPEQPGDGVRSPMACESIQVLLSVMRAGANELRMPL
jgi:hypothetical protein